LIPSIPLISSRYPGIGRGKSDITPHNPYYLFSHLIISYLLSHNLEEIRDYEIRDYEIRDKRLEMVGVHGEEGIGDQRDQEGSERIQSCNCLLMM